MNELMPTIIKLTTKSEVKSNNKDLRVQQETNPCQFLLALDI